MHKHNHDLQVLTHKYPTRYFTETASRWPYAEFVINGEPRRVTIRHNWIQISDHYGGDVMGLFERPLRPTPDECILFEIEHGERYLFDERNNIAGALF